MALRRNSKQLKFYCVTFLKNRLFLTALSRMLKRGSFYCAKNHKCGRFLIAYCNPPPPPLSILDIPLQPSPLNSAEFGAPVFVYIY